MTDSVPHTSTPAPIVERVHYFSTSDEGQHWQSKWCERCIHDINDDCEHIVSMLVGQPDPSLSKVDGSWQCSSFSENAGPASLLPIALAMRDHLERLAADLPYGFEHNLCRSLVRKFDKTLDGPVSVCMSVERSPK